MAARERERGRETVRLRGLIEGFWEFWEVI
jgi:hypothetical protein